MTALDRLTAVVNELVAEHSANGHANPEGPVARELYGQIVRLTGDINAAAKPAPKPRARRKR